jgi:hypothetical protein
MFGTAGQAINKWLVSQRNGKFKSTSLSKTTIELQQTHL